MARAAEEAAKKKKPVPLGHQTSVYQGSMYEDNNDPMVLTGDDRDGHWYQYHQGDQTDSHWHQGDEAGSHWHQYQTASHWHQYHQEDQTDELPHT